MGSNNGTGASVAGSLPGGDAGMGDDSIADHAAPGTSDPSAVGTSNGAVLGGNSLPPQPNRPPPPSASALLLLIAGVICNNSGVFLYHSVYFDVCFGLPHLRRAGIATRRDPTLTKYLHPDEKVKSFVEKPETKVQGDAPAACADFVADNMLARTSLKYDITAVGGCFCAHGFLLSLFNLFTGERWAYSTYALHSLMSAGVLPLFWWYDINCRYRPHVQKWALAARDSGALDPLLALWVSVIMRFPLPVWHHFAHNALCQAMNSYRQMEDAGRGAGEPTEMAWSIFQRLGLILQYCSLALRAHTLEIKAREYNAQKEAGLLVLIVRSFYRAISHMERAEQEKEAALAAMTEILGSRQVSEEKLAAAVPALGAVAAEDLPWEAQYFEARRQVELIKARASSDVPAELLFVSANPQKLKEDGTVSKAAQKVVESVEREHPELRDGEWKAGHPVYDKGRLSLAARRMQGLQRIATDMFQYMKLVDIVFSTVQARRADTKRLSDVKQVCL